jgi:hypothetical protein
MRGQAKRFRSFPEKALKSESTNLKTDAYRKVTPRHTLRVSPNIFNSSHGCRIDKNVVNAGPPFTFHPQVTRGEMGGDRAMRSTLNIGQVRERESTVMPSTCLDNTAKNLGVLETKIEIPTNNGGDVW